ncbi:MAG: hypothetical protein EXR36_15330 [Betaproteobacteria bacterium]|nr:hypothetical protein [Betaproteobacteria bacterium]
MKKRAPYFRLKLLTLSGGDLVRLIFQPLLAYALAKSGRTQDALTLVEATLQWSKNTGESSQRPETERIRGEILLLQG